MNILTLIASPIANAFHKHTALEILPTIKTSRNSEYDFQCNDVMSIANKSKMKPNDLAKLIVQEIENNNIFSTVSLSGPGFINLKLSNSFLLDQLNIMTKNSDLNIGTLGNNEIVIIDFGGPNVAKPLHVGHLRSFVIGESLQRIFKATGHKVISDIHWGDWGLQMGMLLYQMSEDYPYEWNKKLIPDFDISHLENMYRIANNKSKEDIAILNTARLLTKELQAGDSYLTSIWAKMRKVSLKSIETDITKLQANFDLMLGESDVNDMLPDMFNDLKTKELAYISDGALVIDTNENNPPLIIQKSDGAAIYAATDLATIKMRVDNMNASKILYVVDQRQEQHLQSVFQVAKKAGYADNTEMVHVAFGTVNGKDGKPFKTRDGNAAKLNDLLVSAIEQSSKNQIDADIAEKIGIGALKFADLSNDRLSGYVFDLERMTSSEGKTGPYLQYACARINSIVEKVNLMNEANKDIPIVIEHDSERELIITCLNFPIAIEQALNTYQPKEIADYAFSLAQAFSRFYTECKIIENGIVNHSRIKICFAVKEILSKALFLLGIETPHKM